MHVNGAPPMMQASMPGGVPAPVQMAAAVAGPGPGSLAPAGNLQLVFTILLTWLRFCSTNCSRAANYLTIRSWYKINV